MAVNVQCIKLNAIKSVLADVSSISSSSEQRLKEFFGGAEKVGIAKCHIICTTLYVQ